MKYLLSITSLLSMLCLSSCKTPCNQSAVVQTAAANISRSWECKNPAAITAWVERIASRVGVCTEVEKQQPKEGPIASIICPILGMGLHHLILKQVPPEALCNPDKVGALAVEGFVAACQLIPYAPAPQK